MCFIDVKMSVVQVLTCEWWCKIMISNSAPDKADPRAVWMTLLTGKNKQTAADSCGNFRTYDLLATNTNDIKLLLECCHCCQGYLKMRHKCFSLSLLAECWPSDDPTWWETRQMGVAANPCVSLSGQSSVSHTHSHTLSSPWGQPCLSVYQHGLKLSWELC